MPNQERTFDLDGKTYAIRFTQNALYRIEEKLGREIGHLGQRFGAIEIQTMLWASLEGARLKSRSRAEPYTLDEAGDLIDALGGLRAAEAIVIDAWRAAFPGKSEGGSGETTSDPTRA